MKLTRLDLVDRVVDWLLDRPAEAELRRALTRLVEWPPVSRYCDCSVGEERYVCPLHEARNLLKRL